MNKIIFFLKEFFSTIGDTLREGDWPGHLAAFVEAVTTPSLPDQPVCLSGRRARCIRAKIRHNPNRWRAWFR